MIFAPKLLCPRCGDHYLQLNAALEIEESVLPEGFVCDECQQVARGPAIIVSAAVREDDTIENERSC